MTSTKPFLHDKKVALVYDWMDSWGGAERVLLQLHRMLPHADWFTSFLHRDGARWANDITDIKTSFIQDIPFIRRSRRLSTPLYPYAFESFDFNGYDVVISITSSYAKALVTQPETSHVCYMLTPTRFLWESENAYVDKSVKTLIKPYLKYLKEWDYVAAQRPDQIIAISETVSKRIKKIYKRSSEVIYPPFDISNWEDTLRNAQMPAQGLPDSYYLLVSRLRPYKKVDLAVKAFSHMKDTHLVVVGSGRSQDVQHLKNIAGNNIHFISNLTDNQLAYTYGHAQGLIMPQEEDFGYIALEAQVCSCPVIGFNKGGATETVKHKKTGYLFDSQSVQGIIEAVEKFQPMAYTVQRYLQKKSSDEVRQFAQESFITKFNSHLKNL